MATQQRAVGVVGSAVHAPRNPRERSLEEAIHNVGQAALADAGLTIADIDGAVVGANDQLDGRAISIMMASAAVGGVGRDILSTPSAAEHAFVLGALRVKSGLFRTQLVVSWSPLEVSSIPEALRLGNDPYFHRALPLDELSAAGLQANAIEAATPGVREVALDIVRKNRQNGAIAYPERAASPREPAWIAAGKPLRWPLTDTMVTAPGYGLVALVLADADFIASRGYVRPAWIQGMGWATEAAFLGDRNLQRNAALAEAARLAYAQAGVKDPNGAFALAEVADATAYQEMLACEGLGFCQRGDWRDTRVRARFERDGTLPVNISGGALSFNPLFCAGLVRIAEVADQVRGRAGKHQVPDAGRAVAHAASGFAMQYNTVIVMGRERMGFAA